MLVAVGWFDSWLFSVLLLFETAFQSLSSRLPEREKERERKELDRKETKLSKQPNSHLMQAQKILALL